MKIMLSEKHDKYFDKEYPIIYKNVNKVTKIQNRKKYEIKYYYNAIDIALENN
jgi:hypothetical protein